MTTNLPAAARQVREGRGSHHRILRRALALEPGGRERARHPGHPREGVDRGLQDARVLERLLLRGGREIDLRVFDADDVLAGSERSCKRLVGHLAQLLGRQATARKARGSPRLGHRRHAVIGAQTQDVAVAADLAVERVEQVAHRPIEPRERVLHLVAVWSERVSDVVERREADAKEVDRVALAQLQASHERPRPSSRDRCRRRGWSPRAYRTGHQRCRGRRPADAERRPSSREGEPRRCRRPRPYTPRAPAAGPTRCHAAHAWGVHPRTPEPPHSGSRRTTWSLPIRSCHRAR